MTDIFSPEKRSEIMSKVHSSNTKPEILVRRTLHKLGFRYRLGGCDLPGKPDLVFPRYRSVVFVHGCFWHQHQFCRGGRIPKSRTEYWIKKLQLNVERDKTAYLQLKKLGWRIFIIWECEIRKESFSVISNMALQMKE